MSSQSQKQTRQAKTNLKILEPFSGIDVSSEELERATIGAVLSNPYAYHKVARLVNDGEGFFFLKHQYIWDAIRYLADNEMGIDVVTISHRLQDVGQLKDVGGPAILTQLLAETPNANHAETYARMVQRLYSKRMILSLATEIKSSVTEGAEASLEKILSRIGGCVDSTIERISKNVIMTMADHSHDHLTASEEALSKGITLQGVQAGIPALDNMLGGFYPATYLFGARTHEGKTITLSTIALNAAQAGKSVLFINNADGDLDTVLATFYGMESGLSPMMIERRTWNRQQYSKYVDCVLRMKELRLFIIHQNQITPRDVWTQANIIQRTHGLDMIVIDYIQEMGVDKDVRVRDMREKMIYVSSALKDIRKKFNIPVLYGAQIRLSDDHSKQPRIEDAQESKNIIQNADVGIALWHKDKIRNELKVSIQKNKKGDHRKDDSVMGFSSVTGRISHKY
jgi:replicative DNA helicase